MSIAKLCNMMEKLLKSRKKDVNNVEITSFDLRVYKCEGYFEQDHSRMNSYFELMLYVNHTCIMSRQSDDEYDGDLDSAAKNIIHSILTDEANASGDKWSDRFGKWDLGE